MTERESKFQQVYDDFHPRILRYLSRFVDETEAEDLSKEVAQAVEIAKTVRKGAASKFDKFASSLSHAALSGTRASDEACGCGS